MTAQANINIFGQGSILSFFIKVEDLELNPAVEVDNGVRTDSGTGLNEDTCGGTCTADVTAVEVDNGVRTDSGTGLNEDTCGGTCTADVTAVEVDNGVRTDSGTGLTMAVSYSIVDS